MRYYSDYRMDEYSDIQANQLSMQVWEAKHAKS